MQLRAAPAPSAAALFMSYADTVHQSRFSLSSFPLSQSRSEGEKLVFWLLRLQLQCRYSVGAGARGSPAKRGLYFGTFPILQVPETEDELTTREKVLGPKNGDEC